MRTDSLKRLAVLGLSSEQMSVVLDVLAVELAPMERTRELAAQRQQRYIERHTNVRVTSSEQRQGNVDLTSLAPVLDNISKPSLEVVRKEESITSDSFPQDPPGFKDFWAIYPPRAGDRDRKPATKAFAAALKRVDLKTLLAGTERYAVDCKAKGKINTEYVKQARTWLNADGWNETYEAAPSSDFSSARDFLQRIGRA